METTDRETEEFTGDLVSDAEKSGKKQLAEEGKQVPLPEEPHPGREREASQASDEKNGKAGKTADRLSSIYAKLKFSFKGIRHLLPRKGKGEVVFGFDDPYTTGQVLTAVSVVYPFCHKLIDIYPEFDRQVFTAEGHFSGRIRAGTLLLIAGRMLLDKNFRGLLRKWLR